MSTPTEEAAHLDVSTPYQRLIILGSHALQRGYGPRRLTEWYATAYINKVSDHCSDCAYDPRNRLAEVLTRAKARTRF